MPVVPLAAFLTGALLTILLPLALLIALTAWYWWFSVRVPETTEVSKPGTMTAETNPGSMVVEKNLPPEHGA